MLKTQQLNKVISELLRDKIGIFPCDTIWGLIAKANDENTKKLTLLKNRDPKKGLIYLISSYNQLNKLISPLSKNQEHILKAYWPGPITFILNKKNNLKETIAIRYPDMPLLQNIIEAIEVPLLSTSVNMSHQKHSITVQDFPKTILEKIDFLYTKYEPKYHEASTIVDLSQKQPKILRQGSVKFELRP